MRCYVRVMLGFPPFALAVLVLALSALGCRADPCAQADRPARPVASSGILPAFDQAEAVCRLRARALLDAPELPGTPAFDAQRAEVLGRARGEAVVFVREPTRSQDTSDPDASAVQQTFDRSAPGARVGATVRKLHDRKLLLRKLLLPEGYAYSANPHDALALVRDVHISDLFDEPDLWLQRRTTVYHLQREQVRGTPLYRYADSPREGREAQLIFGDRLAAVSDDLASPLHRDIHGFSLDLGFDRIAIVRRTNDALLAELRFGSRAFRAVVASRGAELSVECLVGNAEARAAFEAVKTARASYARSLRTLEDTVDLQLDGAFRFDRPRDEKGPDKDGFLRPLWLDAYRRSAQSFSYDGVSYPVLDTKGRAWPPEVCVDFVLDTFERASGTWFTSPPEKPLRVVGDLDFDRFGIKNRRGVIGFVAFAEEHPELFEVRRFQGAERIPFGQRSAFFAFLSAHAEEFAPGDIVAIQGLKRDGRIHQHAILVETVDPLTGFPHGLADQMKMPRRRTWEGIMAEAPARSLLFRIRLREGLRPQASGSKAGSPL